MRKVITALIVVALLAAVTVVALLFSSRGPTSTQVIKDAKTIPKSAIAFVRNPYKDDYGMSRVSGYVQNRTGTKIVNARLDIQLSDSAGNKKELIKYQVKDILPYSRKSFDANAGPLGGARRADVKIVEIEVAK